VKWGISSNSTQLRPNNPRDKATMNLAHIQGYKKYKGGFMYLNKQCSGNSLSLKMIKELHRHLESYKLDENIKLVSLESHSS